MRYKGSSLVVKGALNIHFLFMITSMNFKLDKKVLKTYTKLRTLRENL